MKRTPLVRTAFHRKEPSSSRSEHPRAKAARCKFCKRALGERERGIHSGCADGWYAANREKIAKRAAAKKARGERESFKARKQAAKRLPDLIAEAQREFNAYIRARDAGKPCICCGRTTNDRDLLTGSRWDCGHYRSTGSASHLRFDERNAHRQLVVCNRHGAGRAVDYRIGLVVRIGLSAVEALEADNTPHKWTREELIAKKLEFRAKRRALNQLNATP